MSAASQSTAPDTNEVLEWTATEAIEHIRSGWITVENYAVQLLERYRQSKTLNAITWIDENKVLAGARSVDAARSNGQALGPLAGLPIVIKDNINTVGFPTTGGTPTLKGFYPQRNARVADILFSNGAILLGKANMHELGRGVTTSNPTYGFAKNPYDVTKVPGGGSGGTGAAISARLTPAGLGSDTAGSSRIPSALCGIAGFRPSTAGRLRPWTYGTWAASSLEDGVLPISFSVTTPGAMGRTVSDVALLNATLAGTPVPQKLPKLEGVRIGVPRGFYWDAIDPEVQRVSENALQKLSDAGVILIDVNLRQWAGTTITAFFTVAKMHGITDLGAFLVRNGSTVTLDQVVAGIAAKDVQALVQSIINNPIPAATVEAAAQSRLTLALQFEDLFRKTGIDAIIYPTVPVLAPAIRPQGDGPTDTVDDDGTQDPEFNTLLRNTALSGVVGTPSLTLPAGLSSTGLPVGISLEGLSDHDSALMSLGLSVEEVLGRVPPPPLTSGA